MPVIDTITMDLYLWRPWNCTIEKLSQGLIDFKLNLLDLRGKRGMKVDDFVAQINTIPTLFTEGDKCFIIINDISPFILFETTLDISFSDVRIIGFYVGNRSSMYMLWPMTEQVFIADVGPD